jgi:hypothetical protein
VGFGFLRAARLACLAVAIFGLTACNAIYTDVKTTPEASVGGLSEDGIVFLSMVEKEAGRFNYNGFTFTYRNAAAKKVGFLRLNTGLLGGKSQVFTFAEVSGKGDLKSLTLPAGSYEMVNFSMVVSSPYGYTSWSAPQDFSIPFTVTPGKATYLGEIRMLPRKAKNIFGINIQAGGTFEIRDMSTRDVPLFQARFKDVDPAAIVISPMRSGTAPADLVTFY